MTIVASAMKLATSHSSRWSRRRLNVRMRAPSRRRSRVSRRRDRLFFGRRLRDRFFYGLQRVLADHALVLLVERQHRLAPHGFFRRRQHVDLGGLRRLYFRQRVVVFLLGDVPYVLGRLRHGLA